MTRRRRVLGWALVGSVCACGWGAFALPAGAQGPVATPELGAPMRPAATVVTRQQQPTDPPDPTLTPFPSPTPAFPTAVPEVPNEERPIIVVESFSTDPGRPTAGTSFNLHLTIANRGEHYAENISASLSSESFLASDQGAIVFWNNVDEGDDAGGDVRLRAVDGLKNGVYPVAIVLRWDDSYGTTYTDSTSIGIPVGAEPGRPVVVVTGSQLPGRVVPGTPFTVQLGVMNAGGQEARNVVVVPAAGPLALVGSGGSAPLTLAPGAAGTVVLRLMAAVPTQPGATSQPVELRYDDPDGERFTDTTTLGVLVTANAAYGPLPMITSYAVDSGEGEATGPTLEPGQVFTLRFEVSNVGAGPALRLRMVLGGALAATGAGQASGLGPFAPVGTGNARFLGTLGAGEVRSVEQPMVTDGAAKPGVYSVSVSFEGVDSDGTAVQRSDIVTLLVARPVQLLIQPLDPISEAVVGEPYDFGVELINAGDGTLRIGEAEMVGSRYMGVTDGSRYVGPLDAGSQDVLQATLDPKAPGKATVHVVVHYSDDFNQPQTVEESFDFKVVEPAAGPAMPEETPSGSRLVRVLKGLLGLGASPPTAPLPTPEPADATNGSVIEPASSP